MSDSALDDVRTTTGICWTWFIVDKQGVIRYKKVVGPKEPWPSNDFLVEELKKLN